MSNGTGMTPVAATTTEVGRDVVLRIEGSEMLLQALKAHGESLTLLAAVVKERDDMRETMDRLRRKYERKA